MAQIYELIQAAKEIIGDGSHRNPSKPAKNSIFKGRKARKMTPTILINIKLNRQITKILGRLLASKRN
jgi:hypothetical protein